MENVSGRWLASNEERRWLSTENEGGELQMENYSIRLYTENNSCWLEMEHVSDEQFVVGFKWRPLVVKGLLKVYSYSSWLQIENSGGLRTENDSGELQMENYRNSL